MPYIVTTKRRSTEQDCRGNSFYVPVWSRRAVATLEEARGAAMRAVGSHGNTMDRLTAYGSLSESGGTVGPLPDGTVIEVERVEWPVLADRADWLDEHGPIIDAEAKPQIINARDARQS